MSTGHGDFIDISDLPGVSSLGAFQFASSRNPSASHPIPIPMSSKGPMETPSPESDSSMASSSMLMTPASPQFQSLFMRTPPEILHRVLTCSGEDDMATVARAAKTCKELRSFIYENTDTALWRDLHLRKYDDPRLAGAYPEPRKDLDWKKRVQDREFVNRLFREWNGEDESHNLQGSLQMICETLLSMYLDLPPLASSTKGELPAEDSRNSDSLASMIRSPLFSHMYFNMSLRETQPFLRPLRGQLNNPHRRSQKTVVDPAISRLHLLLSPDFDPEDEVQRNHRGYLREVVYSAINFGEENDWGPFTSDGKVDWRLIDAIGSIMMANAKDVLTMGEDSWRHAVLPMSYGLDPVRGWGFNDLQRPSHLAPDEIWDWANVQGEWCGSYAFLDYADWISLNEPRLVMLRRSLNDLDLTRYHEAIGDLMRLELVIDGTEDPKDAKRRHLNAGLPDVNTHLPTSNLLPPIRFHGSSVQHNGAITYPSASPASFVRGVVQLTADDPPQVRWTLVIRYGGEDRWRLECVQVGGRGAGRGFFGIWTDALKEEHSPNGPVWYWKP